MQIYIIRHGIAAMREDWEGADEDRPLTGKGIKKTDRVGRGMAALAIKLTHLYTSPLKRAHDTAEIIQDRLEIDGLLETELLAPNADPAAMVPFLNDHEDDAAIGLVGHEPHVSELLSFLLSGEKDSLAMFKKGGVALLESPKPIEAGNLTLCWLMEPNHLVAIGKAG